MDGFSDFIVEFLQLNEEFPFQSVIIGIGIYLLSLWVVISIWVYYDANKRYDNNLTSMLFAFLVFFLNFPMLIFYFAVRPDIIFEDFDDWEAGGVNVPIVNFMGKQGIEMSFELRINPKRLRDSQKRPDMNIQIGWDNDDEKFKLIDRDELAKEIIESEKTKKTKKSKDVKKTKMVLMTNFDEVSGKVKKKVFELSSKVSEMTGKIRKKMQNSSDSKESKKDTKDIKEIKDSEPLKKEGKEKQTESITAQKID